MAWPKGKPRKAPQAPADSLTEFVEHLEQQVEGIEPANELEQWHALGADLVRVLREQLEQRVSVMATESRHMDLARDRNAVFSTLVARAEALLK